MPSPATIDPAFSPLTLETVIGSVHTSFPLLEAVYFESEIAAGNELSAFGAFDKKFKSATENQPVGFYENYRHSLGLTHPVYSGGEVFGGYRIGRGEFEPWYLERETNKGGEFKVGARVPLWRDRGIDARRADLWRASVDRQLAQPEIHQQLVLFVRDGSVAYWNWIAAGQQVQVGEAALELSRERNRQIARKVELGDVDPPVLQDNLRSIAQREAKLIDLQRKLAQAAIKLSLYYRGPNGAPLVPCEDQLSDFPSAEALTKEQLAIDTSLALVQRPELAALDGIRERIEIDLAEAENNLKPSLDALLVGSEDVGEPTSPKRDKSPLVLEASLFMEVPIERRKATGKIHAANAKRSQVLAKRRFVEDKIRTEMQVAFAGYTAAYDRLAKAREARRLADYMAEVERRKFDLGESDLFSVVLREQDAVEAAIAEIVALFELNVAKADYDAAMALDWPR